MKNIKKIRIAFIYKRSNEFLTGKHFDNTTYYFFMKALPRNNYLDVSYFDAEKSFDTIKRTGDWFENEWCEFFEIKVYKKWTVHFLVKKEYLKDLENFNLLVCKAKKWIWF